MGHSTRAGLLKRGILLFWSLWTSIVVLMNVGEALKGLGVLPSDWSLASGNYEAIVHATSVYGTPHWLDMLLFVGAIVWEAACMALFWTAYRLYRPGRTLHGRTVYLAFTALFTLFATFILADEFFHAYQIEGDHRGITSLLLVSLLTLHLLPDRMGEV